LAYREILGFARRTTAAPDDEALRSEMTGSEVAAVGKLVSEQAWATPEAAWFARNFAHVHWIAARNIILYGQGGVDRTIWEASRVTKGYAFLDDVVLARSKAPVSEAEVVRLKEWELPFHRRLAQGAINESSFAHPIDLLIRSNVSSLTFATNGFGPILGMCMLMGAVIAYKLVRQADELGPDNF
jgi:hypothetical protein